MFFVNFQKKEIERKSKQNVQRRKKRKKEMAPKEKLI